MEKMCKKLIKNCKSTLINLLLICSFGRVSDVGSNSLSCHLALILNRSLERFNFGIFFLVFLEMKQKFCLLSLSNYTFFSRFPEVKTCFYLWVDSQSSKPTKLKKICLFRFSFCNISMKCNKLRVSSFNYLEFYKL